MSDDRVPFLCGGTFFVLLLQARAARSKARDKLRGGEDGLKDPSVMSGLNYIITGSYLDAHPTSLSKSTSFYKECQINGDTYITFDQRATAQSFDYDMHNHYSDVFARTTEFIKKYLDESKKVFLVKALLEIIRDDEQIEDDEYIFFINGKEGANRHSLLQKTEIPLQPLIIGIIHYILQKRATRNKEGYATLESWGVKTPHSARNVREYPFGHTITSEIIVTIPPANKADDDTESNTDINPYAPHQGKVPILFDPDGVAPDLATLSEEPILWVSKDIIGNIEEEEGEDDDIDQAFTDYLSRAYEKYEKLRTLLHPYEPDYLKEFYVCNSIHRKIPLPGRRATYMTKAYNHATAQTLKECSGFIILTGTGGLGKTMMLRHLLLDAIDNYHEEHLLPIFIPLKNYDLSYDSLLSYVYQIFDSLGGGKSLADFEAYLEKGSCLLLFDGLDEINSDYRGKFEMQFETFTDRYSRNMFVMSTRPYIRLMSYQRFTILELQPFNKKQALELIDKLAFRDDEPSIKAQFRSELENTLFESHREFAQNPLLLTIMLMTYEQYAKIPSKMHKFYHEAYETLAQKHDATKSAYSRHFKTGLDKDRFAEYFAEFCAVTYYNQKYELTEEEFRDFFNDLIIREEDGRQISYKDFIDDLCTGMCLMFLEGNKYHFTHRSFQEYFCALYFSNQMDEHLLDIALDAFEGKNSRPGDSTFSMLYDMIPKKVEKHIFIPFLNTLLTECRTENGYWSYLLKMHPNVNYECGEEVSFSENLPYSFICSFILSLQNDIPAFTDFTLPFYEEFVIEEYVMYDESYEYGYDEFGQFIANPGNAPELHNRDDVDYNYISAFGVPEIVGWDLEFQVDKILADPEKYAELISVLDSDTFVFKVEYLKLQSYLAELTKKAEPKKTSNLFEKLRWQESKKR